jgi:hypothetical protein
MRVLELPALNPELILRGSFARRVLELAARRDPSTAAEMHQAMRELALAVLSVEEVRLAREVLAGGRFAAIKAVELAEHILAAAAAETPLVARGA